ncbi:MAG: zinc-binding alcohol dehydrogenase family protein [Acidimicrobiia bacterium]|nr:zinc-binding alcohol dehydrogenase family protein [Acidimicrobiia bacterium]
MRAAVYYETGPADVLRYEEVPDPECFPGAVVIQVEAISIEGGDTLNRHSGEMPAVPHIVGYQCAGTIIEVGEGVTDRQVGQKVVANSFYGSHAEKFVTLAMMTWPIPDGADVVACACVPVAFGTAHDCLFEFGKLQAGETVLIQAGAGGVGTAAIQLAKRAGATVLATASSAERLESLRDLGMDHGINYTEDGWVEAARAAAGGWGVNLVVDSVGGKILDGSIACLAPRGRAISVGSAGRDRQLLDISNLAPGNRSLTGVFFGAEIGTDRVQNLVTSLVAEVAAGTLRVVVDRTFPLAEAAAAHELIESRQAIGRVVLIP